VVAPKLICFDCDSTLSAIEGVDELARMRGPAIFAKIQSMTRDAMEGVIPLDQVFGRRLSLIRPAKAEIEAIGRQYIAQIEPTAQATINALRAAGWTPAIVSGGYTQAIRPLADLLGIARIEAVSIKFAADGSFAGYDERHRAGRSGGKPEVLRQLKRELGAGRVVMVGDGASDLETRDVVDLFVGFGRYAERAAVEAGAHAYIHSLDQLPPLLA
jgi:phosphoserine phosphatase